MLSTFCISTSKLPNTSVSLAFMILYPPHFFPNNFGRVFLISFNNSSSWPRTISERSPSCLLISCLFTLCSHLGDLTPSAASVVPPSLELLKACCPTELIIQTGATCLTLALRSSNLKYLILLTDLGCYQETWVSPFNTILYYTTTKFSISAIVLKCFF